jgi:hypothetical protein
VQIKVEALLFGCRWKTLSMGESVAQSLAGCCRCKAFCRLLGNAD